MAIHHRLGRFARIVIPPFAEAAASRSSAPRGHRGHVPPIFRRRSEPPVDPRPTPPRAPPRRRLAVRVRPGAVRTLSRASPRPDAVPVRGELREFDLAALDASFSSRARHLVMVVRAYAADDEDESECVFHPERVPYTNTLVSTRSVSFAVPMAGSVTALVSLTSSNSDMDMHIAMNAPTSVMSRSDARSNGSLNHGEPGRDAHQRVSEARGPHADAAGHRGAEHHEGCASRDSAEDRASARRPRPCRVRRRRGRLRCDVSSCPSAAPPARGPNASAGADAGGRRMHNANPRR